MMYDGTHYTTAYEQEAAQDIKDAKAALEQSEQCISWEDAKDLLAEQRIDHASIYAT